MGVVFFFCGKKGGNDKKKGKRKKKWDCLIYNGNFSLLSLSLSSWSFQMTASLRE